MFRGRRGAWFAPLIAVMLGPHIACYDQGPEQVLLRAVGISVGAPSDTESAVMASESIPLPWRILREADYDENRRRISRAEWQARFGSVAASRLPVHVRAPASARSPGPNAVAPVNASRSDSQPGEPVLIELRVGRLVSTTVQAYRVRSEVLLPLSQLFQLVEIRHRLLPPGRLEAVVDPGGRRIVIDARSDTMRFGERRVLIAPEFRRAEAGELYIGSERLGDLLGLRFAVDWAELTVTVVDPGDLPIARRLRRESVREAYLRQVEGPKADATFGRERPRWDGAVVDYSLFSSSVDPIGGSAYTLGLGADLAGGSLEVLGQSVGPASDGQVRVDASWTGVWRDHRWVKQLRLGDVSSTSPRGRGIRGVLLTNAPYVRPSLVGALRYAGRLELGWSVGAASSSPSIRPMPPEASPSICQCATGKTRWTSSPMVRSARSASSTAPTACSVSFCRPAGSNTVSRPGNAGRRPVRPPPTATCATARRAV
jgi:hypothetical protein